MNTSTARGRLKFKNSNISRLCLGCAQLGMDYGVANRTGGINESTALNMLQFASECGVDVLDTAQAYGESERRIGLFLANSKNSTLFKVVTKVNPVSKSPTEWENDLRESLNTLGQDSLFCLMAHRAALLHDPAWEGFIRKSKADETVLFSGVSIYTPAEFEVALRNSEVDIIQAPINPFDDRLVSSGLITQAQEQGKLIFFRSIFLQGALLLASDDLPNYLEFARSWINRWNQCVNRSSLSAQEILFRYVWNSFPEAVIIFGAETAQQIKENLSLISASALPPNLMDEIKTLTKEVPVRLLNPAEWKVA